MHVTIVSHVERLITARRRSLKASFDEEGLQLPLTSHAPTCSCFGVVTQLTLQYHCPS